jgi:hypothetical protein
MSTGRAALFPTAITTATAICRSTCSSLAAKLRSSDIDASAGSVEQVERIIRQIRARWPCVRILLRADSGFAREAMVAWCEAYAQR